MARSRKTSAAKLMEQVASLSTSAPQVVAHRMARLAVAGPVLSARDRKEFTGMVAEKQLAFAQSLRGMWVAGWQVNQVLWLAYMRSLSPGQAFKPMAGAQWLGQAGRGGLAVLSKGLDPIERKAASNARRLAGGRRS